MITLSIIIALLFIFYLLGSYEHKESKNSEINTYDANRTKALIPNNAHNIQLDKYDVVEGHLVKKQIVKTEITQDKFEGGIIYANEASPYIVGGKDDFPEYPDTIFLLLGKNGKVENERDVLFYGSNNKEYIEVRGGQGTTPISKDNAILGPMGADDFWCNFRVWIGLEYSDLCEMGVLKLDKIDSSIDQILIAHYNYNVHNDKTIFANHLYLRNYIVGLKRNMSDHGWFKVQSMLEENDMFYKSYVKDGFSIEQFSVCYTSAKLERNGDGSWSYVPFREQYNDIMEFFTAYVDKSLL